MLISGRLFELRKSDMKPSIPFLPLAVTVPLRERDVVPMRSGGGGGERGGGDEKDGAYAVGVVAVARDALSL